MFKNNRGVTLTLLVVTIIVMLIIFGITVSSADELLRNSQRNRLKNNLYMVYSRAQSLFEDYNFDGTDNLGNPTTEQQVKSVGWTWDGAESLYIYREWDNTILEEQGIDTKNVSSSEKFIIQYNNSDGTVDVASTKGVVDDDGVSRYTLTGLSQ